MHWECLEYTHTLMLYLIHHASKISQNHIEDHGLVWPIIPKMIVRSECRRAIVIFISSVLHVEKKGVEYDECQDAPVIKDNFLWSDISNDGQRIFLGNTLNIWHNGGHLWPRSGETPLLGHYDHLHVVIYYHATIFLIGKT